MALKRLVSKLKLGCVLHFAAVAMCIGSSRTVCAQVPQMEHSTSELSSSHDAELVAAEQALIEGLSVKAFDGDEVIPLDQIKQGNSNRAPKVFDRKTRVSQREPLPPAETEETKPSDVSENTKPGSNVKSTRHPDGTNPAQSEVWALKKEVEVRQRRIEELERQLDDVKGRLTMAETELSRLSSINDARARASLGFPNRSQTNVEPVMPPLAGQDRTSPPNTALAEPSPGSAALTIVTVEAEQAALRLGPGKDTSVLMTVPRGARLALEARRGEWFRVFAPNGQRAWVPSSDVSFGSARSSASREGGNARIRGYSGALEDKAFQDVESLTQSVKRKK